MHAAEDPRVANVIARARRAYGDAQQRWSTAAKTLADERDDADDDLPTLASDALAHLDSGRWEDAIALCEEICSIESSRAGAANWTAFSLVTSEAAEVGIAVG